MNILDGIARRAVLQPAAPAFTTGAQNLSYRELIARVGRLAAALQTEGVRRGDVVGLTAGAMLPHVTQTLAIAHLGAISVPLTLAGDKQPVDDIVEACGMKFILHPQASPVSLQRAHACRLLDMESLEQGAGTQQPIPPIATVAPDDIWRISLSSGTTGRPKAIRFTHQNAILKIHLMRGVFSASSSKCLVPGTGVGLSFSMNYMLRTLHYGGMVARPPQPHPRALLEMLHGGVGTFLIVTPAIASAMMEIAVEPGSAFAQRPAQLKMVALSGSSVSPRLLQLIRTHLCATVCNNYGATETGVIAMADGDMMAKDPRCAGRIMPWVEVEALDADGKPQPPGSTGLLRVRTPLMSGGYLGAAAEQASDARHGFFRDGWYHSSDIGAVTQDGRVILGGRDNDIINISGVKVDPVRIEQAIQQDPAVIECAVVAVPAVNGVPSLVAVVVSKDPLDHGGLRKRCEALGRHMIPRAFVKAPKLPRNEAGKVMRRRLVERLQKAAAARRDSVQGGQPEAQP